MPKKKRKRAYCAFLLAALLPVAVNAADWNKGVTYSANTGGTIDEKGAYLIGWDPATAVYRTVTLNPDGSIKTGASSLTYTTGTVTANQGTAGAAAWPVNITGTVNVSGTLSQVGQGNGLPGLGLGQNAWAVNATGFKFLSATVKSSGVTTNADTVISLTWAASTTVGPVFVDLNCAGATGINYLITNSSSTPAGFVANSALFGYQPCGQISQIPLEVAAEDTPHLHAVAVTLSATSAALGAVTKIRY